MAKTAHAAFTKLQEELGTELLERDIEVMLACIALVGRGHLFVWGDPGTGKSMLFDRLMLRVAGANQFKMALNRYATVDDVLGPPDVPALANDGRLRRVLEGALGEAHITYLNELWEASTSLPIALLGALNEREIRDDHQMKRIPLSTVYADSNRLPTDPTLRAIYDRLDLRVTTSRITERDNFLTMLSADLDPAPKPVLTWAQVEQAQAEVARIEVKPDVYEAIADVRRSLAHPDGDSGRQPITPTDRRFKRSLQMMRAAAWLAGADTVGKAQLWVLEYMLWDSPEDQAIIHDVLIDHIDPQQRIAQFLLRDISRLAGEVEAGAALTSAHQREALGVELSERVDDAQVQIRQLKEQDASAVLIGQCEQRLSEVSRRMARDLFRMNIEPVRS